MAGTVRGKVDCVTHAVDANDRGHEIYKGWFDFMEDLVTAGTVTRIALFYGDGASGMDYLDGANPFDTQAFAVYRFAANGGRKNDMYVLGQYGEGTSGTGGLPWLVNSTTSSSSSGILALSMASALESDGTTNASPWQGTTVNDGTDSKGTPVWDEPVGGSLAVWPISNQTGFTDGVSKNNTTDIFLDSTASDVARFGFLADDDNLFLYIDESNTAAHDWMWMGPFTWISSLPTAPLYDLSFLRDVLALSVGSFYGDTAGTIALQGGLFSPAESGMRRIVLGSHNEGLETGTQPANTYGAIDQIEEYPLYAYFQDEGLSKGTGGQFDAFMKAVLGVGSYWLSSAKDRTVFGDVFPNIINLKTPWGGGFVHRQNSTREGKDFP